MRPSLSALSEAVHLFLTFCRMRGKKLPSRLGPCKLNRMQTQKASKTEELESMDLKSLKPPQALKSIVKPGFFARWFIALPGL